jgi:hypothetical protein
MPQHQGHLLLPLGPKHLQRLRHLPLARKGSIERANIATPTHHTYVHVLARRHVRLPSHPSSTQLTVYTVSA